jgi:hypothetical protein
MMGWHASFTRRGQTTAEGAPCECSLRCNYQATSHVTVATPRDETRDVEVSTATMGRFVDRSNAIFVSLDT